MAITVSAKVSGFFLPISAAGAVCQKTSNSPIDYGTGTRVERDLGDPHS